MDLKEYLLSGSPSKKAIKSKLIPAKEPVFSTGLTPQQEKEAINSGQDSSNKLQMEKLIPSIEPQVEKNNYENALSKVDSTGSKAYRALTGAFLGLGGQSGREIMDTTNAMRERSLNSGVQNDLVNPESNLTKNYQSLGTQLGIPNAKKQTGHDLSSFVDPFMKLDYLKAKVQAAAARKSGVPSRGRQLSAKEASDLGQLQSVINGTKKLISEAPEIDTSKIGALRNSLASKVNLDDPKISGFKSDILSQTAQYLKYLSGTGVSTSEYERISNSLPQLSDSPSVFVEKAKRFLDRSKTGYNDQLNSFKSANFDVSGYQPMQQEEQKPMTTKLQMPDGSIGEFDLTGKRIK